MASSSDWTRRLHQSGAAALYMHVPFCRSKCAYCDFSSWATPADDPLIEAYARAMRQQVEEAAALGLIDECETAYIGGGTPTLLGSDLGSLVRKVKESAPRVTELSSEANPDSLSDETLGELVDSGATRVSIGVQSLRDEELKRLGRIHTAQEAEERVKAAVASGLDVSVDLMCATPLQIDRSWNRTLKRATSLGVGHVSVYPLAIEEGTPFGNQYGDEPQSWNDSSVEAHRMEMALDILEGFGFERYEVASYALPGKQCRHNTSYWKGLPYLGLGVGAASMLTVEGYFRLADTVKSLPILKGTTARARLVVESTRQDIARTPSLSDVKFSVEELTEREAAAEDLMLGARLVEGLDPALVDHARRVMGEERVDSTLALLMRKALLAKKGERYFPTYGGWLLGNELYGALWGLAEG